MIAIILFASLSFLFIALMFARYAKDPRLAMLERGSGLFGRGPRVTPERFRELCIELLAAMGVVATPLPGDERRLAGRRIDPFHEATYAIFLEPDPATDLVDKTTVLELTETVKAQHSAVGLLLTPYEIDHGGRHGFEVPIELYDGERLHELFAQHLPERVSEIDVYRGFGKRVTVAQRPLRHQPV